MQATFNTFQAQRADLLPPESALKHDLDCVPDAIFGSAGLQSLLGMSGAVKGARGPKGTTSRIISGDSEPLQGGVEVCLWYFSRQALLLGCCASRVPPPREGCGIKRLSSKLVSAADSLHPCVDSGLQDPPYGGPGEENP